MKKRVYSLFSILLLMIIFPIFQVKAQIEKIGISVDKTILNFNILPGQKNQFELKIKNIAENRQRLSFDFRDFVVGDQNKVDILIDKNEIFGMKDWIEIDEKNFFLEPGQEKQLRFELGVPENAVVGSHFSLISLKALPEVDFENFQNPIIGGEIGVYVFANVGGEVSGKGVIENFKVSRIVNKTENISVAFKNLGNIHYVPHGGIGIKNIITGDNNDHKLDKHFVFPGKTYNFDYQWQVPSVFGIYSVQAYFIDQEGQNLVEKRIIFGKYFFAIATLVLVIAIVLFKVIIKRYLARKKLQKQKNETQ